MSRWTVIFTSLIVLIFGACAAMAGDAAPASSADAAKDVPRNIELKPGAKTTEDAPQDKTRQIVTEGKDAVAPEPAKTVAPADAGPPPAGDAATPPPGPPGGKPGEAAIAPPPGAPPGPPPGVGPGEIVIAVQTELRRVGCDPGEIDGVWGGRSREALAAFGHFAKVDVADLSPTPAMLGLIKGKTAVVCGVEAEGGAPPPPADHAGPPPESAPPPEHHQGYGGYGGDGGYGGGGGGY